MLSFEIFVKAMPPSLSELKVLPSFCFTFKIPDDLAVTKLYNLGSEVYFLTIGTEFDIRYGWVIVVYQGFQALPRGRVPNTTEAVIR